ncbi:MAG TPA: ester cyclase [Ktedonobacterales bacterium]|nr:ester cyclase [Ktedonobacterales bacterium]
MDDKLDDNKRVVARFVEVCQNQHDLAAADAMFHPTFVNHYALQGRLLPPTTRPAGAFQRYYAQFLVAFPDATMQIEEQVAERDLVVTRKTFRGTHLGEQWGLPPTGNRVQVEFIDIFRLQEGQLAEHWHHFDWEELLTQMRSAQIGPTPAQPGGAS